MERGVDVLDTFECLLEDAFDDFFFHTARPTIPHDISCTSSIHESYCDIKLMTIHPRPSDT